MADISATLRAWSTTAASNQPQGGTTIGGGLDDNLRAIQQVVRQFLASQGTSMGSGTTVDLATADGYYIHVTGTTTTTALGTEPAGVSYWLEAEGAWPITHNATSLILLGGASIVCAAGDILRFTSEGSGNWRQTAYFKASGAPILVAAQADQETGTSVVKVVTPGAQQYHPSAAKAWGFITTPTTVSAGYPGSGVSVVNGSVGHYTVTHGVTFSSTNYSVVITTSNSYVCAISAKTATTFSIVFDNLVGSDVDPVNFNYVIYGDLA